MAQTPENGNKEEISNPPNASATKPKRDRQARKYGFACANCRKRNARCDGGFPSCERCMANGEQCYFNKVPSVAYSLALQDRVSACENLLSRLREANDAERLRILEEHFNNDNQVKRKRAANPDEPLGESPRSAESADDELTELLNETSVDEDGRICFYGSTSLYHLQPEEPQISRSQEQPPQRTERIGSLSGEIAPWERTLQWQSTLGFNTPSPSMITGAQTDIGTYLNTDINSEICNELLDIYWCWPHHLHLVLCRKVFMRDLVSNGPYVTPFLVNAVLAQAARYSDRPEAAKLGQYFADRTLESLASEVDKGSSIPTIQALLVFSARECACGRTSQGWLYSGMAFRMMRDMGIHIHPRKLSHLVGQFSPVELALRHQVFWSCYTWDKTMSLCLGRPPTLHDIMPVPTTEIILDGEEAEEEPWKPRFATVAALEVGTPQKAKTNSRFVAYCQLCIIIDDVLDTLYSKPHASQQHHLEGFLDRSIEKLEEWARTLPAHLYVREDSRSVSCPPLHILLLNLLYHATIILLCRPYRSRQERARKMATKAAEMIDRLFMLHIRRFGFRVITYLESYTMFVASTVNILDLKEGIDEEAASARLALGLEILRNATSTPSNARCVEIIELLLGKNGGKGRDGGEKRVHDSVPAAYSALPAPIHPQMPLASQPQQQHQQPPHVPMSNPFSPSATAAGVMGPAPPLKPQDDFQFLNLPGIDLPLMFEQGGGMSGTETTTPPGMLGMGEHAVETPLRWLADNVNNDHSWMMMDMDFAREFESQGASGSSRAGLGKGKE